MRRASREGTLPRLRPLLVDAERAAQLSHAWRGPASPALQARRRVVGLYLAASASMAVIALYQTGILRRMPELPPQAFDASFVDASAEAYQLLGMPDAVLALLSNGATLTLATLGGTGRRSRWLRGATIAKVAVDSLYALKLTRDQVTVHRRLCSWCLGASLATWAAVPAAVRESR